MRLFRRHKPDPTTEIKLRAELQKVRDENEKMMELDYWFDRHNIIKKDFITALGFLRRAKERWAPNTTNSDVDDFLNKFKDFK